MKTFLAYYIIAFLITLYYMVKKEKNDYPFYMTNADLDTYAIITFSSMIKCVFMFPFIVIKMIGDKI